MKIRDSVVAAVSTAIQNGAIISIDFLEPSPTCPRSEMVSWYTKPHTIFSYYLAGCLTYALFVQYLSWSVSQKLLNNTIKQSLLASPTALVSTAIRLGTHMSEENKKERTLPQRLLPWALLLIVGGAAILFPIFIFGGINPVFIDLYKKNFIVIIGLPFAALASLFIVVFLEQSQGPIEFKGLGFEFKGASGPVVLWVLCYLAFVISFSVLWNGEFQ